ncbi:MAG: ribonuclease HI [Candidatus Delongbacteria bacterium]
MKVLTLYTDGACSGNPGEGGWCSILIYNGREKKISGYSEKTTNNIMELTAVVEGLEMLKESCIVNVYTDSKYIVDSVTKWLDNWVENGWRTSSKKPVKNIEFWQRIVRMTGIHDIRWNWVKGHDGDLYNEECDKIAREEILKHRENAVS